MILFIALFLGLYWWWKIGRDEHLEETALFDAFFLGTLSYFVVGRLGYVLLHFGDFENIYRVLGFLAFPGLSAVAGIIGVATTILVIAYYQEWESWKVFDNLAASLGIVLVVGSVGSLIDATLGRWADIAQLIWAVIYFVVVVRVRRDFRFYAWYRNDRSVAPDGLPTLVAMILGGILYMIRGPLEKMMYYTWGGIIVVIICLLLIYLRTGRTIFKKG